MNKFKLYILLLLIATAPAFAQQKQVRASIDSTRIKIGSQFHLTLKTNIDSRSRVKFPEAKNFGQLEVLESYPVDTIEDGDRFELIKKYGLTQFEPGNYTVPPLTVVIDNKKYNTKGFPIQIADVKTDTIKQKMFDIKPIATGEPDSDIWLYLLIVVGFILVCGGIYWDVKRRREKLRPAIKPEPIEKALAGLKRLDHFSNGDPKEYYSGLTDVIREYLEEAFSIPAKESTSAGLLQLLKAVITEKDLEVTDSTYTKLEDVLKNADMVKFAAVRPQEGQISSDRAFAQQIIVTIDKAIPPPTEAEIAKDKEWQEFQLKRIKQRRTSLIVATVAFALISTMAVFGVNRIYGLLQEHVLGYSTKTLWEGEWVKSEYGNPLIKIETPKVLLRVPAAANTTAAALGPMINNDLFGYGSPIENFYITVSSVRYATDIKVDFNMAAEMALNAFEKANGAKNLTTNAAAWNEKPGREGFRIYGNMTIPNQVTGKEKRCYYELWFFRQAGSLQRVFLIHEDGDEYGRKIIGKIKKSISFKDA